MMMALLRGLPAQTRQGAPALRIGIRTMQNGKSSKCRARAEKRPADGDYGAPTARRDCSGLGGDSDGVNGSYELGCTCATPPGGLGLAVQTGGYAHHPAR